MQKKRYNTGFVLKPIVCTTSVAPAIEKHVISHNTRPLAALVRVYWDTMRDGWTMHVECYTFSDANANM